MTSPLRTFSDLGPALRLLRETAGLKQVQVAARTRISQGRLSRYENERKIPDIATLDRLLVCYGVDLEGLWHALEEVRGQQPARSSSSDPELTAIVKKVLAELGYLKPDGLD